MARNKLQLITAFLLCAACFITAFAQSNEQNVKDEPLRLLVYIEVSSKDSGLHDRVASSVRSELRKFTDVEILDVESFERLSIDSTARRQRYPNCAGPFRVSVLPLEIPCGTVMSVVCTNPSDPSVSSNLAIWDLMDASPTTDSELQRQEGERYRKILTESFAAAAEGMERIEHHSVIANGSKDLTEACRDVVAAIDENVLEIWRQVKTKSNQKRKLLMQDSNKSPQGEKIER